MDVNKTMTLMGKNIEVNASDEEIITSEAQNEVGQTSSMEININVPNEIPKIQRPCTKTIVKSNNFPKDVKSLLGTGIFNGVPVKYISWSREEQLKGLIHGTGYVCSCNSCNGYKVVKAKELEAHAGCMTKHPNNHIYFPNGKSIYEVVHLLKETPPHIMCQTIEALMEGHVNQLNFRNFKVKYEAGEV